MPVGITEMNHFGLTFWQPMKTELTIPMKFFPVRRFEFPGVMTSLATAVVHYPEVREVALLMDSIDQVEPATKACVGTKFTAQR